MRPIDELRALADRIARPLKLMEVCGTHTVEIFRQGIRDLIPKSIALLSGPGCPVCVTSIRDVDAAIAIAKTPGVILCSFGDMMRVPGAKESLLEARAESADVRVVHSPLDALSLAIAEPRKEVVFFATGFETTSPLVAATLAEAMRTGTRNFTIYSSHKRVPPALKALLDLPLFSVDGFILPGHVSAIIGAKPYRFLAGDHGKPSVITGFTATEIIEGILMIVRQIAEGRAIVENAYRSVVRDEGNPKALALLDEVFEPSDAHWRGIGTIPGSGLKLRADHVAFDAEDRFKPPVSDAEDPEHCSCGDILCGVKIPTDCELFGSGCSPEHPVGPCMVSAEGSCSAYYKYGNFRG